MPKNDIHNIAFGDFASETTCKVFESDKILTNPEEIDYYKSCIKEFEASNRLLGEITDEGEYVIAENVRRDLALLPKEHLQTGYNLVEAYSKLLGKDLYFQIEIEEEEENYIASLYLIEKVSGYLNLTTLKSFIAKIVQPKSDDFSSKAKRVFNVQEVLSLIDEGRFINAVLQIQGQIDYWHALEEIVDLSSQIYVLRMLSMLEGEGELGRSVIEEYNRRMKLDGLENPKVERRFVALRKILDEVIESQGGKEVVFKNNLEQVKQIKVEYSQPVKKVEDIRKRQRGVVALPKQQTKAPAKVEAKSETKKSGTKAAGNKAKKADKKKDKPKKKEDKKDKKDKDKAKSAGGSMPKAEPTIKETNYAALPVEGGQQKRNVIDIIGRPVVPRNEDKKKERLIELADNVPFGSYRELDKSTDATFVPDNALGNEYKPMDSRRIDDQELQGGF